MGVGRIFFQGGSKVVKFGFNPLKFKKQPFLLIISKSNVCTVQKFPVITQKSYFESSIPKILLTSQRWRRSNMAFITNTPD